MTEPEHADEPTPAAGSGGAPPEPEPEGGLDGAIAGVVGFVLSFSRTWGLQLVRPHRAPDLLVADARRGGERYVSAPTFLLIGAAIVGFVVSTPPDLADIAGWLAEVTANAVKALELDEDVYYLLASGLVQAMVVFVAARLGGLAFTAERRQESTSVLVYVLTTTQLGLLLALVAAALSGGSMVFVGVALAWTLLVTPLAGLLAWAWRTPPGTRRRLQLIGAPLFLALAYAVMLGTQIVLEQEFSRIDAERVWVAATGPLDEQSDAYVVDLVFFLDASEPRELADVALCPPTTPEFQRQAPPPMSMPTDGGHPGALEVGAGDEDPKIVAWRRACAPVELSRSWLTPGQETALTLRVEKSALSERSLQVGTLTRLCRQDSADACFSGFGGTAERP